MSRALRACFFARLADPALLDVVDFYRNDIRALEELGFEVVRATTFREIPWDVDLYFTWWWGSGGLSLPISVLTRKPNLFTGTLQLAPELGWWRNYPVYKKLMVRVCLAAATMNVAICKTELGWLEKLGSRRNRLVYQGIDVDLYTPDTREKRDKMVAVVSHLTKENVDRKRLSTLIRAWPRVVESHPEAKLRVVGGKGDGFPSLDALVNDLGMRDYIEFMGRVSLADKLDIYRSSAIYVQPTIYEGFGVAIAEAMACNLPVVTSPRGAVLEVVGQCGLFAEPDDVEGFAAHIIFLLSEPERARALGELGRERIRKLFSYEAHREALAAVLSEVLPNWVPPPRTMFPGYHSAVRH